MIRTSVYILAGCIALTSNVPANAASYFGTGNRWVKACNVDTGQFPSAFAEGVVSGMSLAGEKICIPIGAESQQVGAVFCQYLLSHPNQWQLSDALIVQQSIRLAFPCQ